MADYNPFNPNSVVTPTLFAGRTQQVWHILNKLSQVKRGMSSSFFLHGERGIGKTALAKLIISVAECGDKDLKNLNFLTSYYSVEKGQHFTSVLQASLNRLTDRLPSSSIKRLSERLGNIFKNGKFSFGAFGLQASMDKNQMELPLEGDTKQFFKDQAVSALTNILSGLKEIKDEEKEYDGIFIVLDEIHNIEDVHGIAQMLRGISTTLDVNGIGNISFMVIGYSEVVDNFFEGDPSAKRSFDLIHLTSMPLEEAKDVLVKGLNEVKVTFDEEPLENVMITGGYPHSIQVLGHNLIEVDNDDHIDKEDWETAVSKTALELQTKDFSSLYNFKGKKTLREEILNVLALVGKPISKTILVKEYKSLYSRTYLPELKNSGAIKEDSQTGELTLHSALFRSAILLHIFRTVEKEDTWYRFGKKIINELEEKESFPQYGISDPE
jgi:AAA ATPase-like protein